MRYVEKGQRTVTRASGTKVMIYTVRWSDDREKWTTQSYPEDHDLDPPAKRQRDTQWHLWKVEQAKERGKPKLRVPVQPYGAHPVLRVAKEYLAERKRKGASRTTVETYELFVWDYILPWLEKYRITDIRFVTAETVQGLHDELLEDQVRKIGIKSPDAVRPRQSDAKLDVIEARIARACRAHAEARAVLSWESKAEIFRLFRAILKFAAQRRHITDIPGAYVVLEIPEKEITRQKRVSEEKLYTVEEVRTILAAADDLAANAKGAVLRAWRQHYRCMVYIAAHTGMRISEILGIDAYSLARYGGKLWIRTSVDKYGETGETKNGPSLRKIPLHPVVLSAIADMRAERGVTDPEPNDFLFATGGSNPMQPGNVYKSGWRTLMRRANEMAATEEGKTRGLVKIARGRRRAWHGFRHYAASILVAMDMPRNEVAAFLGHAEFDTTLIHYAKSIAVPEGDVPTPLLRVRADLA